MSAAHPVLNAIAQANASLNTDTFDLEQIKNHLQMVQEQFDVLQAEMGVVDKDLFNLGFDFRLAITQLNNDLPSNNVDEFKHKLNNLLYKIQNTSAAILNKMGEAGEFLTSATPAMAASEYNKARELDIGGDVERLQLAQQSAISNLKIAAEQAGNAVKAQETAESAAQKAQQIALEESRLARELQAHLDGAAEHEKNIRATLSQLSHKVGLSFAKLGGFERLRAELSSGLGRIKIAVSELEMAERSLGHAELSVEPAYISEQVRQSRTTTKLSLITVHSALKQTENALEQTLSSLRTLQVEREALIAEENQIQLELNNAEHITKDARLKAETQVLLAAQRAKDAERAELFAEEKRLAVIEATIAQQESLEARASAVDKLRLMVSEQKRKLYE